MNENLLKPYPYWKNILSPKQMGMIAKGDLDTMARDIDGLAQYVEVLVSGKGASKTGEPLGNKYFVPTNTKCTDVDSKSLKDRYTYIDNVPNGKLKFIGEAMGVPFNSYKGLIPGVMENIEHLNPSNIFKAFSMGENPPCKEVTFETIDNNNNTGEATHYVALQDLKSLEGFTNINQNKTQKLTLPDDNFIKLYFICITLLIVYLVYNMVQK